MSKLQPPQDSADIAAQRWQSLFDDSPFGILIYHSDGTVKDGNRAAAAMFHLSASESVDILGTYNILEDPELLRKGLQSYVEQAFSGNVTALPLFRYDQEAPEMGKPTHIWVQGVLYPLKNLEGSVKEVFMIVLDVTARENARRELDHLYRTSPVGLGQVDRNLRFVQVNERLASLNGRSVEDHIGKTLRSALPELAEKVEPWYRQVLESGQPVLGKEIQNQGRMELCSYYPTFDEADKLQGVSTVVQDISEMVWAQEALLDSEERFREIAKHMRDVFWLFDWIEQRVIYVNPAYEAVWGRSVQPLYEDYTEWARSIHPDDRTYAADSFARIAETGGGEAREYRIIRADGSLRWVSDRGFAIRDDNGNVVRITGIVEDITDRKQAEAKLQESQARLRAVVESAPLVLWAVDEKGVFTLSEGKALSALNLTPGQVVGQSLFDLYQDNPQITNDARQALDGHTVASRTKAEGSHYESRVVPRVDERGETIGAIGVSFDVTDQVHAQEAHNRLENQIQQAQKYESLGVLAGGIAHDFNNLLMGILGNADIALKEIPPGMPGRDYLEQIETTAIRAAELTNQLLAYSGKGKFVVEAVDLNRLISEMGQLLKTVISKKAMLQYHLGEKVSPVRADASQLRQIVMNLIANASEALQEKSGVISLSTGTQLVTQEMIAASLFQEGLKPGTYVFFEVSDTGQGMKSETQERIFDPFFTTKFTGRGLGLAAVLGIVRGHQGGIRLYSEVGKGTTIKVFLPPTETMPGPEKAQGNAPPIELQGQTILVIDDEPSLRQVVRVVLESKGATVLEASDGREGVETFRRNSGQISLIILDMTMPELGGKEVFQQVKAIESSVKVLLTSGYNEQDVTSRFAGKGLAGFISKPFRSDKLLAVIGEILNS